MWHWLERQLRAGGRARWETLCVAGGLLAWFWWFRRYGFDLVDEGTLLAQIGRVHAGARPYVDFETGYAPLYFWLQGLAWRIWGAGPLASRTFGVVVHVATLTILFAFLRRWTVTSVALAITAVVVAFLHPAALAWGGFFNVPYPGWPAALLLLVAQGLVVGVVGRRLELRSRLLIIVGAGLACGLAFSLKPNSGLLGLAASALALSSGWSRDDRVSRWAGAALALLAPLAVCLLIGRSLASAWAPALVVPVALAAFCVVRAHRPVEGRAAGDLVALVAGFVAPVLCWLPALVAEMGFGRVLREVLLLDGGAVIAAYLQPFPWPHPVALPVLGGLGLAAWLAAGRGAALAPLALGLGAAGGTLALLAGVMPLRLVVENILLWTPPAAIAAGALAVGRRGGRAGARERAALAFAAVGAVQLFPRPDLIHLAMIGPGVALAFGLSWRRSAVAWRRERAHLQPTRQETPVPQCILGAVLTLCVARGGTVAAARLESRLAPMLPGVPAAPFVVVEQAVARWAWLDELVGRVAHAPAGPFLGFPDLAGVGVLAGRPQPWRYLYFVPGRPDHDGELEMLASLVQQSPAVVLLGTPAVPAFAGAPAYFARLVTALAALDTAEGSVESPSGPIRIRIAATP